MISPEMLPTHLRDIMKRLLGTPDTLKHDRMVLEQAAKRLTPVGAIHPLIQRFGPVDFNDSASITDFVTRIRAERDIEFLQDFTRFLTTFDDSIGAYGVREKIIQFVNEWHFLGRRSK